MAFTVSLGGVTLNKHMVWSDQYNWTPIRQSYIETLGGGIGVHSETVLGGRPITLEGQTSGWLTRSMVEQLEVLAQTESGVFQLVIGSFIANVMFSHHDGLAFSFNPISFRMDGDDDEWFKGTIKLITI